MSNSAELEKLIRPDSVDADGYHIGKHVIPLGSPPESELVNFQTAQRALGATDHQLAVLADVRSGKLPADRPLGTTTTPEAFIARGVEQKNGDVAFGALTVKKDVYPDFKAALLAEGARDPEMVAIFEKMANDKKSHSISRTDGADSHAPGGDVVWDPGHGAIDYYNEAKMSPARALKHEAAHATQDPETQRILLGIPDKFYSNLEERNAELVEARGMNPNDLMRPSHYSNAFYGARATTDAPQACDFPQLAVHLGPTGSGAARSAGLDVSGSFDHSELVNGYQNIYYRAGGELKAISFWEREVVSGDPTRNPLTHVTEHLEPGDTFNLKIRRDGSATFTNATRAEGLELHPDGSVEARSVDLSKTKSLGLAP